MKPREKDMYDALVIIGAVATIAFIFYICNNITTGLKKLDKACDKVLRDK